ncbi:lysozyme [Flavivirga aquatica]|uniref:Lysozyme n=1 Tax=Flavivirga aquatica TaxID=1849968 RepID=A0A1E5T3M8_9FLAO|nr:N-acetylmuramoyl-L-alanine amidase [Flavivirga aquatica]OEK05993.1 lysozyme [Flavivirga aquatica]
MAKLKYLVIHCTATPEEREVTKQNIKDWHLKGRGWSRVGYCDLIQLDGTLVSLHEFNQDDYVDNWEVTNGAKGYNGISQHIVYSGGVSKDNILIAKDTRTKAQKKALETYIRYMILRHPKIKIIGHNQISNKGCPSFDVQKWLKEIGIKLINIGL